MKEASSALPMEAAYSRLQVHQQDPEAESNLLAGNLMDVGETSGESLVDRV